MDTLVNKGASLGLSKAEVEATIGGLCSVLKKSKNLCAADYDTMTKALEGSEKLRKTYDRGEFFKKAPKPSPLMFLPRPPWAPPGPPPPVILGAVSSSVTAVGKSLRKDKDAGAVKDLEESLNKEGMDQSKVRDFMPVFASTVKDTSGVDVNPVLFGVPQESG